MAAKKAVATKQDGDKEATSVRVRATAVGIYGHVRRRVGDEFEIASNERVGKWMEVIPSLIDSPAPTEGPKE